VTNASKTPIPRKWLCVAALVLLLPWGLYTRTTSHFKSLSSQIEQLQADKKHMTQQLSTKRQLMIAFAPNKKQTETSNEQLVSDLRKTGVLVDTHADNYDKLEKREKTMIQRIDDLERHIQRNSRFAIEQEHGVGPYKVELVVRSKVHMRAKTQTLVFQLAPLDAMPHSVHHFLRMVSERLWEGMSFMPQQNESHRIQASPVDMETLESMDWRFENAKLKNLAFAEHSRDYRCGSYSLGFSGTPGGPDFYVNGLLIAAEQSNDSCFGRFVEGKEIIDSIIDKQESALLGIESLRLLPRDEATMKE